MFRCGVDVLHSRRNPLVPHQFLQSWQVDAGHNSSRAVGMAQVVQSKLEPRVAARLLMEFPDVDHVSGLASSGGETPLTAHPAVEHSQGVLGQRQGSASRARFPFRHESISPRQMYIFGPEAEHLRWPHAGTEDQYADISQGS